jgi:hypothetical protein
VVVPWHRNLAALEDVKRPASAQATEAQGAGNHVTSCRS